MFGVFIYQRRVGLNYKIPNFVCHKLIINFLLLFGVSKIYIINNYKWQGLYMTPVPQNWAYTSRQTHDYQEPDSPALIPDDQTHCCILSVSFSIIGSHRDVACNNLLYGTLEDDYRSYYSTKNNPWLNHSALKLTQSSLKIDSTLPSWW